MARLEQAEIDRIRNGADIVDVISHYTSVQKHGRQYRCICPFHDDHDPSMQINTDRQIYKCFVCGAGGNVFTFVQNFEKVSFVEAVAAVAQITDQQLSIHPSTFEKPVDPHIESIHKVLEETIRYTTYQLDTAERGFSYRTDFLRKIRQPVLHHMNAVCMACKKRGTSKCPAFFTPVFRLFFFSLPH